MTNSNVFDTDVVDITPEMDDDEARKPPSKTSPPREGSQNSPSFTLSLPMPFQSRRPSQSQNSVQDIPRSPSVSLVGGNTQLPSVDQPGTESPTHYLTLPQSSPFAIAFAERAVRQRSRLVNNVPQDAVDDSPPEDEEHPQHPTALIPIQNIATAPADNSREVHSPREAQEMREAPIRSSHFSFLDINSSRGSSTREGRGSSLYTTSSSERARLRHLSELTTASSTGNNNGNGTRPISLSYAFQYHRNSDLGLFRQAQLQPPLAGGQRRESSSLEVPRSSTTPPPLPSAAPAAATPPSPPVSPFRPLPRLPQSLVISPSSTLPPSHSMPANTVTASGAGAEGENQLSPHQPSSPPVLQVQTHFETPLMPPPAIHVPPNRRGDDRGVPFSAATAATTTGLTSAFGSNPGSSLMPTSGDQQQHQFIVWGTGPRQQRLSAISPTESVPLTVSDIHFRRLSDEDELLLGDSAEDDTEGRGLLRAKGSSAGGAAGTSTALSSSRRSPFSPSSAAISSPPPPAQQHQQQQQQQRQYASPFIMQKLSGGQAMLGLPGARDVEQPPGDLRSSERPTSEMVFAPGLDFPGKRL
jgi:hypothetical protein